MTLLEEIKPLLGLHQSFGAECGILEILLNLRNSLSTRLPTERRSEDKVPRLISRDRNFASASLPRKLHMEALLGPVLSNRVNLAGSIVDQNWRISSQNIVRVELVNGEVPAVGGTAVELDFADQVAADSGTPTGSTRDRDDPAVLHVGQIGDSMQWQVSNLLHQPGSVIGITKVFEIVLQPVPVAAAGCQQRLKQTSERCRDHGA